MKIFKPLFPTKGKDIANALRRLGDFLITGPFVLLLFGIIASPSAIFFSVLYDEFYIEETIFAIGAVSFIFFLIPLLGFVFLRFSGKDANNTRPLDKLERNLLIISVILFSLPAGFLFSLCMWFDIEIAIIVCPIFVGGALVLSLLGYVPRLMYYSLAERTEAAYYTIEHGFATIKNTEQQNEDLRKQEREEAVQKEQKDAAQREQEKQRAHEEFLRQEAEERRKNGIPCPHCGAPVELSNSAKQAGHGFCPECGKTFLLASKLEEIAERKRNEEIAERKRNEEIAERKRNEEIAERKQNEIAERKQNEIAERKQNGYPCPHCGAPVELSNSARQTGHGFCPECGKSFPIK